MAQFLPGQHLASSAKSRRSYAAHNTVPVLDQVRPASVEQRAEIEIECVSREHIANELVRDVFALRPGKLARFEYFSKISVLLDQFGALNLKVSSVSFASKSVFPSFISISVRSIASLSNGMRGMNPNSETLPGSRPSIPQSSLRRVTPG